MQGRSSPVTCAEHPGSPPREDLCSLCPASSSRDMPAYARIFISRLFSTQIVAYYTNCPVPCFLSFIFLFNYKTFQIYWQIVSHNQHPWTYFQHRYILSDHSTCCVRLWILILDLKHYTYGWGPVDPSLVPFPDIPSWERSSLMPWLFIVSYFLSCPSLPVPPPT